MDEEGALAGAAPDALGEVELGLGALEPERSVVVRGGGGLRGVEGSEPDARRLRRVTDLRRPLAPRPPPHATVVPARRGACCITITERSRYSLVRYIYAAET